MNDSASCGTCSHLERSVHNTELRSLQIAQALLELQKENEELKKKTKSGQRDLKIETSQRIDLILDQISVVLDSASTNKKRHKH